MDNDQYTFDDEVNRILNRMRDIDPTEEDYQKAAQGLKTLCEARGKKPAFPVDLEVLITAGVNLLGIVLILNHERLSVVTSKAIAFVRK